MSPFMDDKLISVHSARKKLGKKAENLSDKDISDILKRLRYLCNKVIDSSIMGDDI